MPRREIKQDRARETRARILEGAAEAFALHGFAGATVADILKRSGVTKGALYFHFETKEEVADAVLAAHGAWMAQTMRALPGRGAQRLINLGYRVCDALATDVLFQATARLAVERETYGEGRPASFHMWESKAREMLEAIESEGQFAVSVDIPRLSRMLTAALLGLHLSAQAAGAEKSLHCEVEFFWRAVAPILLKPDACKTLNLAPEKSEPEPAVLELTPTA